MARKGVPPESLLEFFELPPFVKGWERHDFPVEELGNLQIEVMADPKRHPVVKGTRGLRKMRYSPVSWPKGKSGALRVCYVYFERFKAVVLVIAYGKSELDDIPEAMKPAFNQAIDDIEGHLDKLFSKGKERDRGK
jgi:hypothetical protein